MEYLSRNDDLPFFQSLCPGFLKKRFLNLEHIP